MADKPDLAGFDGENGYKKDGRGTWYDNGEFSLRHSTDQLPDGSINEHIVTTNKATGQKTTSSETYPPPTSAGVTRTPCPQCGGYH